MCWLVELSRTASGVVVAVVSYRNAVGLHLSQIDEADELLTRTPDGSLASLTIRRVPRTRWRC